jgi:hypothetical protein
MAPLIDDAAAFHLADFIDPVRKLIAAILDMDGCHMLGKVAAVHIGNARHQRTAVSRFRAP